MLPTKSPIFVNVLTICCLIAAALAPARASEVIVPADQEVIRARLAEVTADVVDLRLVAKVVEKDRDAVQKIDPGFGQLCEFDSITLSIAFGTPYKMRIEGKLGMVDFAYIINGHSKIVRAPKVRFSKKTDYSHNPSKLQEPLDVGLITPALWRGREIENVRDDAAAAEGLVKLRLRWPKSSTFSYVWVESSKLCLTRMEKYDGDGDRELVVMYKNHSSIAPDFWIPTRIEIYASTGERAGVLEFGNIKLNSQLPESIFE